MQRKEVIRNSILKDLESRIEKMRQKHGPDICTDLDIEEDWGSAGLASYTVQPDSKVEGTTFQVDLSTGETRHKGIGPGCFWTEWKA